MNESTFQTNTDPHAQLRALYMTLLRSQERFDEFKHLLSLYQVPGGGEGDEPTEASAVRAALNSKVRDWLGVPFEELTAIQVLQWRAILVEERLNIAVSPWKEANNY